MEFGTNDYCIAIRPLKRRRSQISFSFGEKSALEDLPQEILIRILCGVEHDDLKRLFLVSKAIREATLIAEESHFAYSTPRKVGFQNLSYSIKIDAPNAPKRSMFPQNRFSAKNLTNISVALFASGDEESLVEESHFSYSTPRRGSRMLAIPSRLKPQMPQNDQRFHRTD